jgi:hypothetical protein
VSASVHERGFTSGPLARECTRMSMLPKSSFTVSATSYQMKDIGIRPSIRSIIAA